MLTKHKHILCLLSSHTKTIITVTTLPHHCYNCYNIAQLIQFSQLVLIVSPYSVLIFGYLALSVLRHSNLVCCICICFIPYATLCSLEVSMICFTSPSWMNDEYFIIIFIFTFTLTFKNFTSHSSLLSKFQSEKTSKSY